ncbi:MAG: hypothetical protein BMS9Abin08_0491 [Gammaproteobacteria bacterium]|nr:MAG: hypothetical protein BMS9Abin08_0491 [Gammaproteobacteria bacterium]
MLFRIFDRSSRKAAIAITAITLLTAGCGGGGGGGTDLSAADPTLAPAVTLTATPSPAAFNTSTTLNWTATNADSCTASDGWSGSKATSGSQSSGALTLDTTFTLDCTGTGGNTSYSVTVTVQTGTGTAALSWTPPMTNEDGSVLDDLAGYKVYYGTSSGSYSSSITVNNPGIASYVVDNLLPGTHYFVVTAYDTSGNESGYSNQASKAIN